MTASKLKLILAAALFAMPVDGFAQSERLAPSNAYWVDVCLERDHPNACMAQAYCEWQPGICPLVRRAMPHVSDRELARIERVALRRDRDAALCRQEIIGRNEGLIATAPTNWEVDAGNSETNPTPACRHRRAP